MHLLFNIKLHHQHKDKNINENVDFGHILVILRGLRGIRGDSEFSQKYENSQFVGIT